MAQTAEKLLPPGTGRTVVLAALATMAVELGVWFAARWAHAPADGVAMALLAVCLLWTIVAGPIIAAGGANGWSIFLRAGAVADASGAAILIAWLVGSQGEEPAMFAAISVLKIYATLAAVALLAGGAVYSARSATGRHAMALVAAAVLMLVCASPFLVNGLLTGDAFDADARQRIATATIRVNPFYSMSAAVVEQTHAVWHQRPMLYNLTRIGEYVAPPPAEWYDAGARCLAVAALMVGVGAVRRRHAHPTTG